MIFLPVEKKKAYTWYTIKHMFGHKYPQHKRMENYLALMKTVMVRVGIREIGLWLGK